MNSIGAQVLQRLLICPLRVFSANKGRKQLSCLTHTVRSVALSTIASHDSHLRPHCCTLKSTGILPAIATAWDIPLSPPMQRLRGTLTLSQRHSILGMLLQRTITTGWSFCTGIALSHPLQNKVMRLSLGLTPAQKSGTSWDLYSYSHPIENTCQAPRLSKALMKRTGLAANHPINGCGHQIVVTTLKPVAHSANGAKAANSLLTQHRTELDPLLLSREVNRYV